MGYVRTLGAAAIPTHTVPRTGVPARTSSAKVPTAAKAAPTKLAPASAPTKVFVPTPAPPALSHGAKTSPAPTVAKDGPSLIDLLMPPKPPPPPRADVDDSLPFIPEATPLPATPSPGHMLRMVLELAAAGGTIGAVVGGERRKGAAILGAILGAGAGFVINRLPQG